MDQILNQIIALAILAAVAWGLTKLLRCKPFSHGISEPRKSSMKALAVIVITVMILGLFEFLRRTAAAGILGTESHYGEFGYLVPAVISFIIFLLPAGIMVGRMHEPLRSVGITGVNLWQSAVMGVVFVFLMFLLQNVDISETLRGFQQKQAVRLFYFALIGFEEEILFRGYLQTRLVAWLGKLRGWGLASVIMAVAHFPLRMIIDDKALGAAVIDSLALIPASLFFGFIMLRTGNVLVPGVIHTLTNWLSEMN